MTKITVDKDLIEQAIEALTKSVWFCNHMGVGDWQPTAMACHSGIAALRASLAQPAVEPVATLWERFPAYLIDTCEGEIISEEGLQRALADMLSDPRYAAPVPEPVVEPEKTNAKETNADLDFYSNAAINEQRRNMVGEVAVGRSLGNRQHQSAGNSEPQGTVAVITGFDEYGPFLGWNTHWVNFPVGTKLYTSPPPPPAEPRISTEHCSLAERQRHQASVNHPSDDLYCPRCQCSESFLQSRQCEPHIVYEAPPTPAAEVTQ